MSISYSKGSKAKFKKSMIGTAGRSISSISRGMYHSVSDAAAMEEQEDSCGSQRPGKSISYYDALRQMMSLKQQKAFSKLSAKQQEAFLSRKYKGVLTTAQKAESNKRYKKSNVVKKTASQTASAVKKTVETVGSATAATATAATTAAAPPAGVVLSAAKKVTKKFKESLENQEFGKSKMLEKLHSKGFNMVQDGKSQKNTKGKAQEIVGNIFMGISQILKGIMTYMFSGAIFIIAFIAACVVLLAIILLILTMIFADTSKGTPSADGFIWPLPEAYQTISSPFGQRICPFHGPEHHDGIDIPAPTGTDVYASRSGTVTTAIFHTSLGYYIVIDHGDDSQSLYLHNSKLLVQAGDQVTQGQVISKVGSTGSSTGAHLDFRVKISGVYVNPMEWIGRSNSPSIEGENIEEQVWNYLEQSGYSKIQIAAIMGNIKAESGFDPSVIEQGNGIGFGLCQWSFGRRKNLEAYAASKGKPASDLETQLEFLISELVPSMFSPSIYYNMWLAGNIDEATEAFMLGWERPANRNPLQRQKWAREYYKRFK